MAKRKSKMDISQIVIILVLIFCFVNFMMFVFPNKKEGFNNIKENFEEIRGKNTCGSCRVKNQG